jgi:hypothetical protein
MDAIWGIDGHHMMSKWTHNRWTRCFAFPARGQSPPRVWSFGVQDLEFRVWCSGSGVQVLGFEVWGLWCRVWGKGLKLKVRVCSLGFRV